MLFVHITSLMPKYSFQTLTSHFLFSVTRHFGVEEALVACGSLQNEVLHGNRQDKGLTTPLESHILLYFLTHHVASHSEMLLEGKLWPLP